MGSFQDLGSMAQEIVKKAQQYDLQRKSYLEVDGEWRDMTGERTQEMVDRDMADVSTKYADVPGLFAPFESIPDPGAFDYEIGQLDSVLGKLSAGAKNQDPVGRSFYPANTTLDGMDTTAGYIQRWTGVAASTFKENFVDTFESVTQNQFLLTGVIKGALQAQQGIWTGVRKDIVDIADKTLSGIEHCDDCGKNDWTMAFAVVGAVISIAAVPVTGGASLALAAVGGAVAVGGTAIGNSDEAPSEGYSGESAEAVVEAMRRAITSLKGHITDAETKIQKAMNDNIGVVNANRDLFVAPRPNLANADPGNVKDDFGVPR